MNMRPWKMIGGRYILSDDDVLVADLYADSAEDFGLPSKRDVRQNGLLILKAVNVGLLRITGKP